MKHTTLGVFQASSAAEAAINALTKDSAVSVGDISYVYRNVHEGVHVVKAEDGSPTVAEGAVSGAVTGGTLGALAGIATVAGLIPVIGPIFAAGPLITALGLGSGALATTAAAVATGAAAGSLIGALASLGVSKERAEEYEERVMAGDTLVSVESDNPTHVATVLNTHGASQVESYPSHS